MLDFTEDQKLAQSTIRAWCTQHLEPKVRKMESGELSVYPVMRELAGTFGIPDMARATFAKMKEKQAGGEAGGASMKGMGDAALMAILTMELTRCCPGFALAFGATLGLFGGAVMARGTLEQKERCVVAVFTLDQAVS